MTLSAADRRRKLWRQFLLTSPPKGSPPMGKRKPFSRSPPKPSPSTSSGNHAKAPPAKDLSPATSTPASDASIVNPISNLAAQLASSVPCSSTETLILKTAAPEFAAPAAEPASTPVIKSATFKAPASIAQTSRSGTNGGDLPVTDKPEFALAEPGVSLVLEPAMKLGVPIDDKAGELEKYWKVVSPSSSQPPKNSRSELIAYPNSSLGNAKDFEKGCTSFQPPTVSENPSKQPSDEPESSGVERDSSDVLTQYHPAVPEYRTGDLG
ncbi:hypothetical protein F2Q69_00054711 [Brassica cretica]|uniref:Uncharacterized protein n=1 Tax=Brassica cretica TaxID=69181 RepID=A0A8S9MWC2_BRACR|nr:hypothetical protein F2Q69_00054711 [Brassica cretica]